MKHKTLDLSNSRTYSEAALHLREAITRNREDKYFSDGIGKELVYIFDSNIFIFSADLNDTLRLTDDIGHLLGTDLSRDNIRVLERLTASFLISSKLPGQLDTNIYISLPHFEESLLASEAIAKKLKNTRFRI